MLVRNFLITILFLAGAAVDKDTEVAEQVIHVAINHPNAGPGNPGTAALPLASIDEAMKRAVKLKRSRIAPKVIVHPGLYREQVAFGWTNWKANQPDNEIPIIIEASEPGTVTISGADIVTDWKDEGAGIFSTAWNHDWGVKENQWQNDREVPDIVFRREMVFVNDKRLTQVLAERELVEGSFLVDETANKLLVRPVSASDFRTALVEVGVRDVLWNLQHEWNVSMTGINFEKAVTPWKNATGAVRVIGSNNFSMDQVEITQNNGSGIVFIETENVRVTNSKMNHNGWDGWGSWRVTNMVARNTETSYNNWRGHLGQFYGWSVGNKLESTHGLDIKRHRAVGNYSRGMWLDFDMTHVTLDEIYSADNLGDGIWVEAAQGPIEIRNSLVCGNGENGLKTTFSTNVDVTNSKFVDNVNYQFMLAGKGKRWVKDFATQERIQLRIGDWRIRGNAFAGGKGLVGTFLPRGDWDITMSTFEMDENTFVHENDKAFQLPKSATRVFDWQRMAAMGTWQSTSGQDATSTFRNGRLDCSF